jgi:hypothetical protein
VAADQNLDSDDGLQKALKKLQLAAGIFQVSILRIFI